MDLPLYDYSGTDAYGPARWEPAASPRGIEVERFAATTAERAECNCPDFCDRDHEQD